MAVTMADVARLRLRQLARIQYCRFVHRHYRRPLRRLVRLDVAVGPTDRFARPVLIIDQSAISVAVSASTSVHSVLG